MTADTVVSGTSDNASEIRQVPTTSHRLRRITRELRYSACHKGMPCTTDQPRSSARIPMLISASAWPTDMDCDNILIVVSSSAKLNIASTMKAAPRRFSKTQWSFFFTGRP